MKTRVRRNGLQGRAQHQGILDKRDPNKGQEPDPPGVFGKLKLVQPSAVGKFPAEPVRHEAVRLKPAGNLKRERCIVELELNREKSPKIALRMYTLIFIIKSLWTKLAKSHAKLLKLSPAEKQPIKRVPQTRGPPAN